MSEKKITSVSLDADLVKFAKKHGIKVSRVANDALKDTVAAMQGLKKPSDVEREILLSQKEVLLQQLELKRIELKTIEERLQEIDIALTKHQMFVEERETSSQIAEIMQEVNDIIDAQGYDIQASWIAIDGHLKLLENFDETWDLKRFETHVETLKRIRGGE